MGEWQETRAELCLTLKRPCEAPLRNTMEDNKLSHRVWSKRHFNPSLREDVMQYKYFLDNKKWPQNCPFILEWPYLTMQEMIRDKLIKTHFDVILDTLNE